MRDEAGRITMWVGSNTDVHDIKLVEACCRSKRQSCRICTAEANEFVKELIAQGKYQNEEEAVVIDEIEAAHQSK